MCDLSHSLVFVPPTDDPQVCFVCHAFLQNATMLTGQDQGCMLSAWQKQHWERGKEKELDYIHVCALEPIADVQAMSHMLGRCSQVWQLWQSQTACSMWTEICSVGGRPPSDHTAIHSHVAVYVCDDAYPCMMSHPQTTLLCSVHSPEACLDAVAVAFDPVPCLACCALLV